MHARSWLLFGLVLLACDGAPASDDRGCGSDSGFPVLRFSHASVGVVPGSYRDVYLEFAIDCTAGADLVLSASEDGVIDVPAMIRVEPTRSRASLRITGVREGLVTLTATASHPSGEPRSASIEVAVTSPVLDACSGMAEGTLEPGGRIEVASGSLSGTAMGMPAGAAREDSYHVEPFVLSIGCDADVVVPGYHALGPAVRFAPGHMRFARELPLTIPLRLSLLPSGANRGHVEVAYRGPHDPSGRIVSIASPMFEGSAGGGRLSFEVPRLGTYQAVARDEPPRERMRNFTFRGLLGISMGGSGTGRIGLGNPQLFDFIAPLGGPTDWRYMLEHIRRYHVGGFCTEEQRVADPTGCAEGSSLARVPATTQLHEHPQHFEHWWYEDGHDGQGGTFDRNDYISIFRDLAAMFGNPNSDRSADPLEPNITPPGVPESHRLLSAGDRCLPENRIVIAGFDGSGADPLSGTAGRGFFDDEFNPEGTYDVITFCDGGQSGDIGQWDPNAGQNDPIEVVLAVDLDGDGIRDRGEPVIRNGREPFDDFGLDGVRNELETSADGAIFDAIENPDPAGDDFDFQYNPTGTENNWDRDTIDGDRCRAGAPTMAEAFRDVGIDGVPSTRQLAATANLPGGGFDIGEGNGCFDRTRGADRMIESSPRWQAERLDMSVLRDLDVFADGGIRDLFNWAVMGNVSMAGWSARGLPVRFYNNHVALHLERRDSAFDYRFVPWEEVGQYAMVRYGDPDSTFAAIGDGGHVGTTEQIIDRIQSTLSMMSARWPGGDRRRVATDTICTEITDGCRYQNNIVFEFTASTGRRGPVTVLLPPGYFFEEYAQIRYPVLYFLHGYGQTPEDLRALSLVLWQAMSSPATGSERRMQKVILVFPDGRCRNDECLRGTFYTDAPESTPNGARMQTFLLDLMAYIDANYRTRAPESWPVLE